jgi:hypothetical protein
MKKIVCIALAAIALFLANPLSGLADRGGHGWHGGHVGVGISVGPVWGPMWWGAPYYPYYPYYAAPPIIVQQPEPEIYVEPAPQPQEPTYWYYCQNPKGYYPYVKQCQDGWMKVVPSPPPQLGKE